VASLLIIDKVFNLVTQQDSFTTTLIARETKADSSSMKTIAAPTMVFLPGTFMSSVFGLKFVGDAQWWLYVAITLPLTAVVVMTWWFWTSYPVIAWLKAAATRLMPGKLRRQTDDSKV
jgi:Mg2+ and Co2+ transporter CorA